MKIKIYQSFYDLNQKKYLDENFEELDNTTNLKPELREFYLNKICYNKAILENLNFWGVLSWKYNEKIKISSEQIFEFINKNKNYDVYFFNPYYISSLIYYNIWENGKIFHKHIIDILENLFPLMNIENKYLYEPMKTDNMFYCCYIIANKNFWDKYNETFEKYFDCLNKLDENVKKLYFSSANYKYDYSLNYFPFIHERFLNSFVLINNFNVCGYHFNDKRNKNKIHKKIDEIKNEAILEKNKKKLLFWIEERNKIYKFDNKYAYYLYERCSW